MNTIPPPSQGGGDASSRLRLPFTAQSVGAARRHLRASLGAARLPARVIDDALIVVSELATNALRYGLPTPSGHVEIGWWVGEEHLEISVLDSGRAPGLAAMDSHLDGDGGRGLAIVDRLSESWASEQRDGLRVTARLAVRDVLGQTP